METKTEVTKASPHTSTSSKQFWNLTWPIWIEMLLGLVMGNSDTLMLSFLSDHAVAAVALANQYIMLALLLMQVIATGTQVVLSQYLGARRWEESDRITFSCISLNVLAGGLFSLILVIAREPLLRLLHIAPELMADASAYLLIVGGFLFLQSLVNGISGVLKVYGHVREAMLISVGMNVLHIGTNMVMIFGMLGFPAMGVQGAALSTVISRLAAAVVLFILLLKLRSLRLRWTSLVKFHLSDLRNMLKIGVPAAIEAFTYHLVQTAFLAFISTMGTEALAARQYAMNITMFISVFGTALGFANSILVGKLTGAGRYQEAYEQTRRSMSWSFMAAIVVIVLFIIFRHPLIGLFSQNPLVLKWGGQLLMLNLLVETGRVLNMNLVSALNAAGDAKFPVWMGLIFMVGLSLPAGYGLAISAGMGLVGIWIATGLDEWLRGLANLYRWNSRRWESYTLVKQAQNRQTSL
ncbi:MATE family efflux transporter [Paenibacillus filicis]|uniref:MATE family efflux transporter n=1 Tax=Paenibacillus filicis TaxID=669464 RepID=A0ABU9DIL5_9BACL